MKLSQDHLITSEAALRNIYKQPGKNAIGKELDYLDPHCKTFIARSPFICIATVSPDGFGDNSPKGDAPGFVRVLDDKTIAIPDRRGNNRLDSIGNVLKNPQIGLIFFIPGVNETLRINGKAEISVEPELLQASEINSKLPLSMMVVHIAEAYLQCPKALIRSSLWEVTSDFDRKSFPSITKMISEQMGFRPTKDQLTQMEAEYEQKVKDTLY